MLLKIANPNPIRNSQPTNPTQDTQTLSKASHSNQPQSPTLISYVENPYTFEERHASLSKPFTPAHCYAPLREPYYEAIYISSLSLQQDFNRTRQFSQNQFPNNYN